MAKNGEYRKFSEGCDISFIGDESDIILEPYVSGKIFVLTALLGLPMSTSIFMSVC